MSDESTGEQVYASARSVEGLLQRGRGLGALQVSRGTDSAASAEAVYGVVLQDWRWDSTVDDRHLYLARLIRESGLGLGPVCELLAGDADDCERGTRILELLALSGSGEAREALRRHVREGEHWVDVIESVAGVWPVEWWDDLADVVRGRLTGEERLLWRSEPWVRWGVGGRYAPYARSPRTHVIQVGASSRRLLSVLADAGSANGEKAEALRLLAGRPPEPGLIPLVPELAEVNGELPLPQLARAIRRLGAPAVPAAREWAVDGGPWLSWNGVLVLAEHGEVRDVPVLLEELSAHERARLWCGPSLLADGLARFGAAASDAAPMLRRLWLRTPHSYERPAYLKALRAIAPAGLDLAYTESLWDCESNARLLGIASAPDSPYVRERLVRLRDDPMEEAEVRAAAGERLAGTS
ncbi:hypothetical protein Sipo8835_19435 [Streptomyces ipomoeae]|uniref:HEAT repeat domain-containing protein n=1 Tax=Streptomyces ipomoeae TaxID=103232 RepID=A0AAE8W2G0_9ACTN|nr:hypothetical protein [Streptomyces ipomoeae]TQE32695.1 hypothetical protein Sipo8835_19435 [Streptomyces ipomoeae]